MKPKRKWLEYSRTAVNFLQWPPYTVMCSKKASEPVNTGCATNSSANGEHPNVKSRAIPCQATVLGYRRSDLYSIPNT